MSIAITRMQRTARPMARRARGLRRLIAWLAVVALVWPSLGPLPYVVGAHVHSRASPFEDSDHRHVDASAIPGSPTHPIDHDCPECRVLKHLSRCILPLLEVPVAAMVATVIDAQRIAAVYVVAQVAVHVPPVRAPPHAIA